MRDGETAVFSDVSTFTPSHPPLLLKRSISGWPAPAWCWGYLTENYYEIVTTSKHCYQWKTRLVCIPPYHEWDDQMKGFVTLYFRPSLTSSFQMLQAVHCHPKKLYLVLGQLNLNWLIFRTQMPLPMIRYSFNGTTRKLKRLIIWVRIQKLSSSWWYAKTFKKNRSTLRGLVFTCISAFGIQSYPGLGLYQLSLILQNMRDRLYFQLEIRLLVLQLNLWKTWTFETENPAITLLLNR